MFAKGVRIPGCERDGGPTGLREGAERATTPSESAAPACVFSGVKNLSSDELTARIRRGSGGLLATSALPDPRLPLASPEVGKIGVQWKCARHEKGMAARSPGPQLGYKNRVSGTADHSEKFSRENPPRNGLTATDAHVAYRSRKGWGQVIDTRT